MVGIRQDGARAVYSPPLPGEEEVDDPSLWLPDLDHPGTRAFLLEDVRREYGEGAYVRKFPDSGLWECHVPGRPLGFKGSTEAEALLAALEAAPIAE